VTHDKILQVIIKAKDETSSALKGLRGRMQEAERGSKMLAGAMLGIGVAAAGFGVKSVEAFMKAEVVWNRFETVMKNVVGATEAQSNALKKQCDILQTKTRFDNEAIMSAQAFLGTFKLTVPQIEKMTLSVLDMAEGVRKATGGTVDLEQVSNMCGKAIATGMLGPLKKVGVTLSETQMELFKTADQEERVAMLSEILKGNFEGLAVAAGETLAGRLDQAKNLFGDIQEEIGARLAPAIGNIIERFTTWVEKMGGTNNILDTLSKKIQELTPYLWVISGTLLAGLVPTLYATAAGFWATLVPLSSFLVAGAALGALAYLIYKNWEIVGPLFEKVKKVFLSVVEKIKNTVMPIIQKITSFVVEQFGVVVAWVKENWPLIQKTITTVMAVIGAVIGAAMIAIKFIFNTTWPLIKIIVSTALRVILGIVKTIMQLITGNFSGAWKTIKGIFSTALTGILNLVKGLGGSLYTAGKAIIQSLINGIKNTFSSAYKTVKNGLAKIRRLLPFSDAKEGPFSNLTESGQAIMKTLAKGVEMSTPVLHQTLSASLGDGLETRTKTTGGDIHITGNTFNIRDDSDIKKIAQELFNLSHRGQRAVGVLS